MNYNRKKGDHEAVFAARIAGKFFLKFVIFS